jgi:hypothetical protein
VLVLELKYRIKRKKMSKDIIFTVGDPNVSNYQRFIIFVGFLALAFFSVIALVFKNPYYAIFPFIVILLFAVIILLYTKLYSAKYSTKYFYLSNLFFKKQISTMDFIEVKGVKHAGFLLKIVFKEEHFYLLVESNDFFRDFFRSGINCSNDKTSEIKQNIAK